FGVVDPLEEVDIEDDQAEHAVVTVRIGDLAREAFVEVLSVVGVRERVTIGRLVETMQESFLLLVDQGEAKRDARSELDVVAVPELNLTEERLSLNQGAVFGAHIDQEDILPDLLESRMIAADACIV